MTIYIIYFFLVLIIPFICSAAIKNHRKAQETALKILMFMMYLILALKGVSVGNDIEGYKATYEFTKILSFSDFSYAAMESGYMFLMKVCNMIGMSFQLFAALLYAIILYPIYLLIKRYSPNVMISVMVLLCLEYFVFTCSALRQSVGISICVLAFLLSEKLKGKKAFIYPLMIIILASFFHKSALIFIPLLFVIKLENRAITYTSYVIVFGILFVSNRFFLNLNTEYNLSKYEYSEDLKLGLLFVFYCIMYVFNFFSNRLNKTTKEERQLNWRLSNIFFYALIIMVAFNGSIFLRSAKYELVFLSIIMPRAINAWDPGIRRIISLVYVSVLFYFFYALNLVPKVLNVVPYHFFFE